MEDFQQIVYDVLSGPNGFEGTVPWPYLDTHSPPLVTVGVGCAIPLAEAVTLPFTINGIPVINQDITNNYHRVLAMESGKPAWFYAYPGCLMLSDAAIEDLLQRRFDIFSSGLRKIFPSFDTYPVSVKAALLEMAYGLGMAGFMKYTHLIAAVKSQDWKTASSESGVNVGNVAYDRRNEWVRNQFLQAVE